MKIFHSKWLRLVVVALCLMLVVGQIRSILGVVKRGEVVGQRREMLQKLELENQKLQEELVRVQSPEFVERVAREKLGMVREGEAIVIVQNIENSEQKIETQLDEQNWKKWWRLFF